MKNKILSIVSILSMLLCLTGCGGPEYEMTSDAVTPENNSSIGIGSNEDNWSSEGSMVITTSWIDAETKNYDEAKSKLTELVKECGGYFISSEEETDYNYETNKHDGNRTGWWEIRIPSDKFNTFNETLGSTVSIIDKSILNEDVTEEFYEKENYIIVYTAERDRILALMDKAETVSDLIVLEDKLTDLNHKIDNLTGELKHIENKISFSTISLKIRETKELSILNTESFAEKFVQQMFDGYRNFIETLQDIMLWLAYHFVGLIILSVLLTVLGMLGKAGFDIGTEVNLIFVIVMTPVLWLLGFSWFATLFALFDIFLYILCKIANAKTNKKFQEKKLENKPVEKDKDISKKIQSEKTK